MAVSHNLLHGIVHWFDKRKGFGFINVISGDSDEYIGKDIFVHHTNISVQKSKFKSLIKGEYVSFYIEETTNEKHPIKAIDVMGAFRGLLLIDTQYVNQQRRRNQNNSINLSPRSN